MHDIICPHCGKAFKIDEAGYPLTNLYRCSIANSAGARRMPTA